MVREKETEISDEVHQHEGCKFGETFCGKVGYDRAQVIARPDLSSELG